MKEMTSEEIKNVSFEILQDVHDFCVRNKIKYSLYGGTLIGCIRHKGFVPWDDDVDVGMPRPDYERFINTYKSNNHYEVLSRELSNGNDVFIAFSRVCDMEKTFVDDSAQPWTTRKTGVWIDVFPLDGVGNSYDEYKKTIKEMEKLWHKGNIIRWSMRPWSYVKGGACEIIKQVGRKIVSPFISKSIDKHILKSQEIEWENSTYFANISFMRYGDREVHNKRVLDDVVLAQFGDSEFYIMNGYDEALKEKYGNYMQFPPKNEQVASHDFNEYYWK